MSPYNSHWKVIIVETGDVLVSFSARIQTSCLPQTTGVACLTSAGGEAGLLPLKDRPGNRGHELTLSFFSTQ